MRAFSIVGVGFIALTSLWVGGCSSSPRVPSPMQISVGIVDAPLQIDTPESCNDQLSERATSGGQAGHGDQIVRVIVGESFGDCSSYSSSKASLSYWPVGADGAPTPDEVATAIDEARIAGVDLLNVSIAFDRDVDRLRRAVESAVSAGMVIVAAAGNNYGLPAGYPAAYDGVIAVGSISAGGRMSQFTAVRGVDVFMPGEATAEGNATGDSTAASGTSFAAAMFTREVLLAALDGASVKAAAQRLSVAKKIGDQQ